MEMKLRRSSRSRSKTPFTGFSEVDEKEIQQELTMRQTRSTTVKTTKITSSGDNHVHDSYTTTNSNKNKSDKSVKKSRYKTSDYSSEEGDQHVSSTLVTDQNITNQFLEENRRSQSRASESSHTSALDYYRAAGDYWNKFPKTDYTYSPNSKDRKEISPGVVCMPNMSRRSLHSDSSYEEYLVSHKLTNTDDEVDYTPKTTYAAESYNRARFRTATNNHNDNFNSVRTSRSSFTSNTNETVITKIYTMLKVVAITILTWLSSLFYVVLWHKSAFVWLGKKIHKAISRVMLSDTQILKRSRSERKLKLLLALCLIPLLFFAGWWLLFGTLPFLYGSYVNVTDSLVKSLPIISTAGSRFDDSFVPPSQLTSEQLQQLADLLRNNVEEKQYEEAIIQKVLQDSNIQNVINNYNKLTFQLKQINQHDSSWSNDELKAQHLINTNLREEIQQLRSELSNLNLNRDNEIHNTILQLRNENIQHNARIASQIKRCCRINFIRIESYITKLLKDILGAPNYLSSSKDISDWLHATFVAKDALETHLANLTQNLKSDYDALIENNGKLIMEQVVLKISQEFNNRVGQINRENHAALEDLKVDSLTDEYVKKIVRDSLAVYDADKTGLVDYALESAGGQVLSTRCTESYTIRTSFISIFGIPVWYPTFSPRTAIKPGVTPGECWAFQNFPGFLLVKLAHPIKVEAFSLEHISKLLTPSGKIDSAPKEFSVYGLRNETDNDPVLLGEYEFDENGPSLQYFAAAVHNLVLSVIELRIFSNHGNPNYTCLYRFRVHGHLVAGPT